MLKSRFSKCQMPNIHLWISEIFVYASGFYSAIADQSKWTDLINVCTHSVWLIASGCINKQQPHHWNHKNKTQNGRKINTAKEKSLENKQITFELFLFEFVWQTHICEKNTVCNCALLKCVCTNNLAFHVEKDRRKIANMRQWIVYACICT